MVTNCTLANIRLAAEQLYQASGAPDWALQLQYQLNAVQNQLKVMMELPPLRVANALAFQQMGDQAALRPLPSTVAANSKLSVLRHECLILGT